MADDLFVSVSGAIARLRDLETVSNNLANAETAGYKRDLTLFRSALEQALEARGEPVPGSAGMTRVGVDGGATDFTQGPAQFTGQALDVAIQGDAFFQVETPEGPRFTRAGSFRINAEGQLATPSGHPVLGRGGPIEADGSARITPSGDVIGAQGQSFGQLALVEFPKHELTKAGENLWKANDGAEQREVAEPELAAATLERSNVAPVSELARLVALQRAFEIQMRMFQTQDESTQQLLQEVNR
jgi:flagellar basal body rod protein FlgG